MKHITNRVRALLWLLVFSGACTFSLKTGAVEQPYDLNAFAPFVKQGFITREGWQGGPITLKDPHLYLYDPVKQTEWAALEFQTASGQIHTVLLRWASSAPAYLKQQVLLHILKTYGEGALSMNTLNRLLKNDCSGVWSLKPQLFFTLAQTPESQFFKFSRYGKNTRPTYAPGCAL